MANKRTTILFTQIRTHLITSNTIFKQKANVVMSIIHSEFRPLLSWQEDFINSYIREQPSKSLLIAHPGTGKTVTSITLAIELFSRNLINSIIVLSTHNATLLQWKNHFGKYGIKLNHIDDTDIFQGLVLTHSHLRNNAVRDIIHSRLITSRCLIIVDESDFRSPSLQELNEFIDKKNLETKLLFLARSKPTKFSFDSTFLATTELYVPQDLEINHALLERIQSQSPSFPLIQSINHRISTLDSLSWQDFERLIAELLERDGYKITQMQGSKDGGVDVIGYKDMPLTGTYKVLMQAKKYALHRKVGLSLVRELADTVSELDASKGVLVTTSYLTSGALNRIQLHQYKLHKLDRDDLSGILLPTYLH